MSRKAKPTTPEVELNGSSKKRQRRKFLLLVREGPESEFQELVQLDSQRDCQATAEAIRKIGEMQGVALDNLQFTSRILSGSVNVF